MPRPQNSQNNFYHYEVIMEDTKKYIRTLHLVAQHLGVGSSTIIRKLKNPEMILRKYKNKTLIINKCKVPIYNTQFTREEIEY